VLRAVAALGHSTRPKPRFGHLGEAGVGPFALLGSFHPSQQNTFTGKLTPAMLDEVFVRARALANRRQHSAIDRPASRLPRGTG
jgi:uracil-DNA glycosylase